MRSGDTLYNQIITCIQEEGYTIEEFAKILCVHRKTLYRYLTKKKIPKPIRKKMIELLGGSVEQFITAMTSEKPTVQTLSLTQQASFMVQSVEGTQAANEASSKKILILPPIIHQEERVPLDCFTWHGQNVNNIQSISAAGQPFSCQQIQAQIRAEIERMLMPRFHAHDDNEVRLSRRTALAALATLSTTLITKARAGQWSALDIEEFLTQCAQSITACHHLMRDDGLATVAYTLPRYLPILSLLAEQKTLYQKQAADLAAQGHRLSSLLALHRMDFTQRARECHRMLHFSKISGNENLIVFSMILFGVDFLQENPKARDPEKSLYWYQQAEQLSKHISPLLKSKLFIHLGRVHAQCGHIQEALKYMRLAQEVFPDLPEDDEFAMLENSSSLAMWEGNIYLDLGRLADQHGQPHRAKVLYEASWDTIAQLEGSPAKLTMPKRLYIETINLSSKSAIALNDYERFEQTLLASIQGAKELGSQKRYEEASENYRAARHVWKQESKMLNLADALIEWKPPSFNA